jgi:hypothetical protein
MRYIAIQFLVKCLKVVNKLLADKEVRVKI